MTTAELASSLPAFTLIAGRLAEDIDILAADALADLDVLTAGILELRERLTAGTLDTDSRGDIAGDLVSFSDKVLTFALAVAA